MKRPIMQQARFTRAGVNLQKRHQALHQMVRVGVRTQWLDRDHGMPAGDIGLAG